MAYLDLLKTIGPTPEDLAKKQKEMDAAREKQIKEGAKQEISNAQERITELRANPSRTYNRPWDPEDCSDEHVQKFQKVRDPKEEFDYIVNDLALNIMCNAETATEAIQGYTKQLAVLKKLQCSCINAMKHFGSKLSISEGPEKYPGAKTPAELKTMIDYHQKVYDWSARNITATQEKIKDELNHNSLLIAEYIEFSGITPSAEGIKAAAATIAAPDKK